MKIGVIACSRGSSCGEIVYQLFCSGRGEKIDAMLLRKVKRMVLW